SWMVVDKILQEIISGLRRLQPKVSVGNQEKRRHHNRVRYFARFFGQRLQVSQGPVGMTLHEFKPAGEKTTLLPLSWTPVGDVFQNRLRILSIILVQVQRCQTQRGPGLPFFNLKQRRK